MTPARSWALAWSLFPLLACPSSSSPGGFGDDGGDSEDGDEHAAPPDLPQAECDPRRSEDCELGHKCSYFVSPDFGPTNQCVEVLGEGLEGEPCERIGDSDTCANHHICWATDNFGLDGVCVSFCSPALLCEDALATCSVSSGGLLSLCLPKCDPLFQDCAEGWGCYPDEYQRWACDRDQSGGAGAHGDACACLNCCDPGLICMFGALIDAEGCGFGGAAGCCGEICALNDPTPAEELCPTELEACEAFYDSNAVLMGYGQVGLCQR